MISLLNTNLSFSDCCYNQHHENEVECKWILSHW